MMKKTTIRPPSPYFVSERRIDDIIDLGASPCSTPELLAVVLGGKHHLETAHALMERCQSLARLCRLSGHDLMTVYGLTNMAAAKLLTTFELTRRIQSEPHVNCPQITCPADAAQLVMAEMSSLEQEHLRVMLLDTRQRVMGVVDVYKGSVNSAVMRVSEVFREAVRRNAPGIIILHNHPSGDPSPSPEDVSATRELVQAGKLLDIEVLDHLVIGYQRFVSLKERRMGFA